MKNGKESTRTFKGKAEGTKKYKKQRRFNSQQQDDNVSREHMHSAERTCDVG